MCSNPRWHRQQTATPWHRLQAPAVQCCAKHCSIRARFAIRAIIFANYYYVDNKRWLITAHVRAKLQGGEWNDDLYLYVHSSVLLWLDCDSLLQVSLSSRWWNTKWSISVWWRIYECGARASHTDANTTYSSTGVSIRCLRVIISGIIINGAIKL